MFQFSAHRRGVYMKRMVLVVLFCVLCATAIYSQSVPRGRGGVDPGLTGPPPIFNNSNPWDLMRVPVTVPALSRAPQAHPDDFVSVSQLHIPSKAIKEFARSQQAIKSGDLHGSTAHLQKALRI